MQLILEKSSKRLCRENLFRDPPNILLKDNQLTSDALALQEAQIFAFSKEFNQLSYSIISAIYEVCSYDVNSTRVELQKICESGYVINDENNSTNKSAKKRLYSDASEPLFSLLSNSDSPVQKSNKINNLVSSITNETKYGTEVVSFLRKTVINQAKRIVVYKDEISNLRKQKEEQEHMLNSYDLRVKELEFCLNHIICTQYESEYNQNSNKFNNSQKKFTDSYDRSEAF